MLWVLKRKDGSFEHPKHMFKLMGEEINAILGAVHKLSISEPMQYLHLSTIIYI